VHRLVVGLLGAAALAACGSLTPPPSRPTDAGTAGSAGGGSGSIGGGSGSIGGGSGSIGGGGGSVGGGGGSVGGGGGSVGGGGGSVGGGSGSVGGGSGSIGGGGGSGSVGGGSGSIGGGAGTMDGGAARVGPVMPCQPLVLDCLDPSLPNVIEVPTELSLGPALSAAQVNDIVQVKGLALGAGWRVPAYVTLRGCAGASLQGNVAFTGSGGTVEGFIVSGAGAIIANRTGSYVVRRNRFVPSTTNVDPVEGLSTESLVSASVTLVVEQNWFEGRTFGVIASTRYDTLTHAVDLTVRNNVFTRVAQPVRVSEGGLVGVIVAKVEHNTFHDFTRGLELFSVDRVTKTSGNLFVTGTTAITGSPYEVAHTLAWQVTTPAGTPPLSGSFAVGDPRLVDAGAGDLRLDVGSAAADRVPAGASVPAEDFQGCPRPAGAPGATPLADIGAYESQP
jgi:hypothetical protein